jgi:hypothetical protein
MSESVRECRARERAGTWMSQNNNYYLNITLKEQLETLERLGLPVPVIESDREEDYASDTEETGNP